MSEVRTLPLPLPPVMNNTRKTKRGTRVKAVCEPVFLKKLYDHLGTGKLCGDRIGVSAVSVTVALKSGSVSTVIEQAARGVYEREFGPPPPPSSVETDGKVFISMLVDKEIVKVLKPWLQESGVDFKVF